MAKEVWVNARFLTQQKSGVQQFAIELCREVIKINSNIKFIAPKNILHETISNELNVHTCGNRTGQLWEQIDLPKFLKKNQSPLLINLCNSAPINYHNSIITIHDLSFIENPKWFSFRYRTWYKFMIPQISKTAKHIITVSKFSKNELIQKLTLNKEHITIIYNGLSNDLIQYKKSSSPIISREKIILSVGSINPRKNLVALIEAFHILNLKDYELFIVGGYSASFAKQNFNLKSDGIKFLGHVSDEALWDLYKKAEIFVFPSLYEGFGIPVLEASYFGCPILVNKLEVFKELYTTFKINYTEGERTNDYVKAIQKIKKYSIGEQELSEENLASYSYSKGAFQLHSLINKLSK